MKQFGIFLFVSVVFGVLRFVLPASGELKREDIPMDMAYILIGILCCWSHSTNVNSDESGVKSLVVAMVFFSVTMFVLLYFKVTYATVFKCIAHMWIGVLIQWAFLSLIDVRWFWENKLKTGAMLMAIGLTVLEVVAFIVRKGEGI